MPSGIQVMPQVGFGDRNITELCQQYNTFANETEIENDDRNATAAAQTDDRQAINVTTTQQERGLILALINLRLIDFSKTSSSLYPTILMLLLRYRLSVSQPMKRSPTIQLMSRWISPKKDYFISTVE